MLLWRPMAGWTVLTWLLVVVVLAPLSSYVLGWQMLRGRQQVVGNEAILAWATTVPGIAWMLLAGGFALIAAVVRFAGIFQIITDHLEDRPVGLFQTALDLAPRLPRLFRLCVAAVAAGAIPAVALLAGLVAIRAVVLGEFDINYYLAERPAEWTRALLLGAGWTALIGVPTLYVLARSVLALPAYLDGHEPLRAAIRESWARTRGEAAHMVRILVITVALWLGIRALLDAAYVAAGSGALSVIGGLSDSLGPVVAASGAYILGLLALDVLIEFVGFSFAATVLTKAYYEDTDLHAVAPPGPGLRAIPGRVVRGLRVAFRPTVAVPVATALVAVSMVVSGVLVGRLPEPGPVIITAHRAGPPPAPENTLAALGRAIDAGADRAEIDVQRTGDGVVVVAHDADLMRTAGDPRRIRGTPYPALADVVQRPDDGSPPSERRVATLAAFLERSEDRIGLVIELKYNSPDPELADAVVRTVRAAGMSGEVRIMSLDYAAVREVERLAPRIATGYVATAAVGDMSRLPVDFLAVSRSRITPDLIRTAERRGVEVHAWTVNGTAEMADLIERGVHGLITDHPARARRVSREIAELSPAARLLLRFRDLLDDESETAEPARAEQDPGVEPTPSLD
ncbi:MAG: glycerophosphodiester phosphodiesterase family protein [Longimicrobiales bacterium]